MQFEKDGAEPVKVKPNAQNDGHGAALSFLRRFHPRGPWLLTSIREGAAARTASFSLAREADAGRWIARQQAEERNVYFLAGEPENENLAKKAKKADIAAVHFLWVDLDCGPIDWRDAEAFAAETARLRGQLEAFPLPPTAIVHSGGGLQAFWKLREPESEDPDAIEAANKALAEALGGDHCHNIDRIMRLPGTVNFPNAKKRAAGRGEAWARLEVFDETRVYGFARLFEAAKALAPVREAAPAEKRPAATADPVAARPRATPDAAPASPGATAAEPRNPPKWLLDKVRAAVPEGERSKAMFAAACALFEHGLDEAAAVALFSRHPAGVAAKYVDRGGLAEEVARCRAKWRPERRSELPCADGVPKEIELKVGERPRITDEALAVIRHHGLLYERGGELVRLRGASVLPVDEHWLADHLARRVRFYRMRRLRDGSLERAEADPPGWLGKTINAKSGERGLHELTGVITAPTLRPDGSLLNQPGFDRTTGLCLLPGQWPVISEKPGRGELEDAWRILWEPFAEFPYVGPDDEGVLVSAVLTAVVRRTLPLAPAHSFDAPVAGSGKTLLATCVAELCGAEPSVIPECREEEELRKRLLSAQREDQPSILLDNIKGQFASSAFEAFLTSPFYSDRVLGATQMLRLPTSVLVLISGNNFIPRGDLWRRIVTARIDPRVEHAERRCFRLDARKHCQENRQKLVAAALTLLRGFIAAGRRRSTPDRLASFEAWDDLVRQCVLWLAAEGIAAPGDPTASIAKAKEKEPGRQKLGAFLEAARDAMGAGADGRKWRVGDLIQTLNGAALTDAAAQALRDAVMEIAGDRGGINPRILGRWLERCADARCGGLYVERAGEKQRAVLWRIQTAEQ
jgi:hypothetical protein